MREITIILFIFAGGFSLALPMILRDFKREWENHRLFTVISLVGFSSCLFFGIVCLRFYLIFA